MTQMEKLIAGFAAPSTDGASFQKRSQSDLVLEQFAGILNQSSGNLPGMDLNFTKPGSDVSDSIFSLGDAKGVQQDYAKFSQGVRTIAEAKQDTVNASEFGQKVSELAEQVEEVVQETMQVSDEEFAQVMESLGFSPMDLLNPQNLIQVVQTIFGSDDVSALLVDANFQMALQQVTGLIQTFQQENGLDAGTFGDLLAQLSAEIDKLEEAVEEILQTGESSPEQLKEQFDQFLEEAFGTGEAGEETAKVPKTSEENVATVQLQDAAAAEGAQPLATEEHAKDQTAIPLAGEAADHAQTGDGTDGMLSNTDGGRQEKMLAPQMEDQTGSVAEHAPVFQETEVSLNMQTMPQAEVGQAVFSYLEVEQLMNQMEGLARAFASAEGTTLEMQLNPESLGRLFLTVTEKQGAVTAQIAASNEQVKEALQTQMVELRATLQAQGLKVEAVEVTVATHEFEQNLDGNASANGQMQQEQAERQHAGAPDGRRNLNLNSLDELSGLMSEEEALVAQMMRDNGGTVDYIA